MAPSRWTDSKRDKYPSKQSATGRKVVAGHTAQLERPELSDVWIDHGSTMATRFEMLYLLRMEGQYPLPYEGFRGAEQSILSSVPQQPL